MRSRVVIIHFYTTLLKLFPRPFQDEYREEMQGVFEKLLSDSAGKGAHVQMRRFIKEIIHLPIEALRQHHQIILREGLQTDQDDTNWSGPPSSWEKMITAVVFFLPIISIILKVVVSPSMPFISAVLICLILSMCLFGLMKGFPRWSLPYLGVALSLFSFYFVFQWTADLAVSSMVFHMAPLPGAESARSLLQVFWAGMTWLSLFALISLLIGILSLLRRFQPLLNHIRRDWTLISYTLYGGVVLTLSTTFEQNRFDKQFVIASTLSLACGAWLFLYSKRKWRRILALVGGITLAMWCTSIAQVYSPTNHLSVKWLSAAMADLANWPNFHKLLLEWVWMLFVFLAPALIRFLPSSETQTDRKSLLPQDINR